MRQPFLHDADVTLKAPSQVWTRQDGDMRAAIDGVHVSDVRVLRELGVTVSGSAVEHVRTDRPSADRVVHTALLRGLDDDGADPRVRLDRARVVDPAGMTETLRLTSGRDVPIEVEVTVTATPDLTPMPVVKAGGTTPRPELERTVDGGAAWGSDQLGAAISAQGMRLQASGGVVRLVWRTTLDPHGQAEAGWTVRATDAAAVVAAPPAPVPLRAAPTGRPELDDWLRRALDDLEALQLTLPDRPGDVFLAAGAPWFFTLFGRDSIWGARLLLPIDLRLAEGTLRVLARLQGVRTDDDTAERPGGILHELRRGENPLSIGVVLPPRYYGTIDATPLWILLLHDAWRAGLSVSTVRELLPALRAALGWLRAAVPADGFLAYEDATGRGLANQGWKDSGDSVQWADGRLARGPIALCEVQAYAYEAAIDAARLLRSLGESDDGWDDWAADLKARFRGAYWVEDAEGGHPAIALDAEGRAVDSLTSNIGHLLGTGLLDAADEARVAALLVDPRLDSGLGLRTLSSDSAGYWPLSYHGGSVWAHDTAIAVLGLRRAGFPAEARTLAEGLLTASRAFDGRMPELHGGDPASAGTPVPYPASCRPQAWSAAAAVAVRDALTDDSVSGSARRGRMPATTEPAPTAG